MLSEKTIETLVRFAGPLVESGMISNDDLESLRNLNQTQKRIVEVPNLISLQEVAELLKVTVKTVYEHINRGDLELVKLGHRTSRITMPSLQAFIDRGRKPAGKRER